MEKRKLKKRRILTVILVTVLVMAVGIGGYAVYGSQQMEKLPGMPFAEMLAFATKDNKDAVITVGIIRDGKMTYDVFGANGVRLPQEERIYEIGSITKTFTTSLLCQAIEAGKIRLDDTIDQYLALPARNGYPTIRKLVTHTSGYQSHYFERPMIANFLNRENSFRGISEEMLLARLGKINLRDAEHPFSYSNFGMAALGAVLEKVYGQDYAPMMNDYAANRLGLKDTRISNAAANVKNGWHWSESDAYLPAGALVSDITDMLQYLGMHMDGKPGYLAMAHEALAEVNATSASFAKLDIRIDAVGAGWMIDRKNGIVWHNGGTGSYNSYMGFDKGKRFGVVILSNLPPNAGIPATVLGTKILTTGRLS